MSTVRGLVQWIVTQDSRIGLLETALKEIGSKVPEWDLKGVDQGLIDMVRWIVSNELEKQRLQQALSAAMSKPPSDGPEGVPEDGEMA